MHQPYTTDNTRQGQTVARNAMRIKVWADPQFAHRWLCHPGKACDDGCDVAADPAKLALYQSEIEAAV